MRQLGKTKCHNWYGSWDKASRSRDRLMAIKEKLTNIWDNYYWQYDMDRLFNAPVNHYDYCDFEDDYMEE